MTYVCKPNKCIACDTIIHLPDETMDQKTERGVYKEVVVELSNGSKMKVGVCNVCKEKVAELDVPAIIGAIKEYWASTIRESRVEKLAHFTEGLTGKLV